MLHSTNRAILAVAAIALIAGGLTACGSSSSSTSSTTAQSTGGGDTVSTKSVGGVGTVLVDSKGDALYTNNMDSGSKIACTGQCTTIWVPLDAPAGGSPTSSDSSVQAKLGVVKSPNGTSQVTFGGKPLYSFVQDSPGQVTGDGVSDSFGGTSFVWTAATTSATGGSAATTTSGGSSSPGY
jgi:predicted lipoprotein with Yx(FWY)xxD motif